MKTPRYSLILLIGLLLPIISGGFLFSDKCEEVLPALEAALEGEDRIDFISNICSCTRAGRTRFEASCTAFGTVDSTEILLLFFVSGDNLGATSHLCGIQGNFTSCVIYPFKRRLGRYRDATSCTATINSKVCDECTVFNGAFPVPSNSTSNCTSVLAEDNAKTLDTIKNLGRLGGKR